MYQAKENDDLTVYNAEFIAGKRVDNDYMYFSRKDYTINGYLNGKSVYSDSGSVDMAVSRRVSFSFYVDIDGLDAN